MTDLIQPQPQSQLNNPPSPPEEFLQTPLTETPQPPTVAQAPAEAPGEIDDITSGSIGVIRRTTIPFLAKHRFSRFISPPASPSPPLKDRNGDVPFPRQSNTPSPCPSVSLSHQAKHSSAPTTGIDSYALSKDSALMDFYKGSLELTPLPRFEDSQSYFVGWDQTPPAGRGQGCVSETEAGWSRSGVRGWSFVGKAWSDMVDERRGGDAGKKRGWGWLTV
ncbi:hypothetical protein I302_103924 [Kwoniella bestiolae CBS 10118]|uniref:Uncharacterized protein n=1 Tax=Kwoniella bestiolae CBS 10118 TaxID=1296100 RepID=A0A1B9G9X7_9TREE|nr:hypothetical protein I302_02629 [Kwoniella bestiolae CBS 10118]OCF27780.1 hypothetical protein I302_02629 [Kwoniella bestiolae CBS 10118]